VDLDTLGPRWDIKRTVDLPVYANNKNSNLKIFKLITKHWKDIQIPEEIPVLALATKHHGNYSDTREAQNVNVLLIWNDGVCRIVTLDWFEGPLEDCITPEWYIRATEWLQINPAFEILKRNTQEGNWKNQVFSIYPLPSCLGQGLKGNDRDSPYKCWDIELRYSNYAKFIVDLDSVLSNIRFIFQHKEVK